jgi:hypothetical protein
VYITRDDGSIVELKEAVGIATNNVAEYRGLLAALAWAVENRIADLHIRADSDLLVKQMRREYRVKNEGLKPLWQQAQSLARTGRPGEVRARAARAQYKRRSPRERGDGRSSRRPVRDALRNRSPVDHRVRVRHAERRFSTTRTSALEDISIGTRTPPMLA